MQHAEAALPREGLLGLGRQPPLLGPRRVLHGLVLHFRAPPLPLLLQRGGRVAGVTHAQQLREAVVVVLLHRHGRRVGLLLQQIVVVLQ